MPKKKGGGGGGGGGDASKKATQKKKNQIIEDKTFGLKNKNKSKKVQQHIKSVEKNVLNSGDARQRRLEEQRKKAKADARLRKKEAKAEQDALFGEALLAVQKKGTSKTAGKIEAKGRDADDDDNKKSTSRAMKMMYQMDAKEMDEKLREDPNYVPTLEDEIELQRSQLVEELQKQGKTGTPVNPETFAIWQERKLQARKEAAKQKVEAELKKKKGGKGLSVLSGRDLYEYKKELFKDDEDDDERQREEGPTGMSRQSSMDVNNDNNNVEQVATKVESALFLQGNDEDLDDLMDDDDD